MALNQKAFERKLQNMNSTQESVQTVSLWIIHHKKQADEIVLVWLDQLKKVPKPDRRLTLFYLANDVLQNSRKKTKNFITAFSKVLREAMPLLSDKSIDASVQRVVKIWEDRKVFEKDFLQGLRSKLDSDSRKEKKKESKQKPEETKVQKPKRLPPADFKPSKVTDSLKSLRDFEAELTLKESQLNSLRIDASDAEIIGHLKDRAGSTKFWQEYEEASHKLEEFCQTLVKEQEQRKEMVTLLQDGEAFFDVAFGEVKVIVNAYKTFGSRLNSLKKKLDTKINKLAVKEAERAKTGPVSAPTGSFLSTGLPLMMADSATSSPTQTPTRKEDVVDVKEKDTTVDNIEVSDMDIEDDSDSEKPDNSDTPATQSSEDNTPSHTSTNSDIKASSVDVTPSTSTLVATAITVTTVVANTTTGTAPTFGLAPTTTTVSTTVGGAQAIATPALVPSQATLLAAGRPGLVPPPMPPAFMGLGMPVRLPLAGFGMPQMVPVPAALQNGPRPMLVAGSGLTGLPYQGHIGQLPVTVAGPNTIQSFLPSTLSRLPDQFGTLQTQVGLVGNLGTVTATTTTPALASLITTATQAIPGQAVSSKDKKEEMLYSPTRCEHSPQSDDSAPSPEGSPELNLDDVVASTSQTKNTKLNGFQTNQSFLANIPSSDVKDAVKSGRSTSAVVPESASSTPGRESETSGNSTPGQAQQEGKSVSAVDILAKLLSRGRQLKEQAVTNTPPRLDTPPSVTPPRGQPVEAQTAQGTNGNQKKPLLSIIDSLFPKLSDSLKTLKQKEQHVQSKEQVTESPQLLDDGSLVVDTAPEKPDPPTQKLSDNSLTKPSMEQQFQHKGILRGAGSCDKPSQPRSQFGGHTQAGRPTQINSGSSLETNMKEIPVTEKGLVPGPNASRDRPPSQVELDRLKARRLSEESATDRSPRPPFGRHSPRALHAEGPSRRASREDAQHVQNQRSPFGKPLTEIQEGIPMEKHSPRGGQPEVSPVVDNLPNEQQSKSPFGEASKDHSQRQERKGPPITPVEGKIPLASQSGTFGYTKQDPTVASDFGIEPRSPEPVQVTFPVRPPMRPRGPGQDFMRLRGPLPGPGPDSFGQQPRPQREASFPGVIREREIMHPNFEQRNEFWRDQHVSREFPFPPERFQHPHPGHFPRGPDERHPQPKGPEEHQASSGAFPRGPEEQLSQPGPFPRSPKEHRSQAGPFPRVPEEHRLQPGTFPRGPEEHHSDPGTFPRGPEEPRSQPRPFPRGPEEHHSQPGPFPRGPDEARVQPGPFPRGPEEHRSHPRPFPRGPEEHHPRTGPFPRGPEEHRSQPGPFPRGPEEHRPQPGPFPRGPEEHRPQPGPFPRGPEEHRSQPGPFPRGPEEQHPRDKQRSPELRSQNPMDFRNDNPSSWTSFEGGRQSPPRAIDQEQRQANIFPDRPFDPRVPNERQRPVFQSFGDKSELAQRDLMMKRPGPPIRFPGPPPHKRPFPF